MRALETERKRNNERLRKNAKRNGRTYRTYEEYRVYVPDRYTAEAAIHGPVKKSPL